MSSVKNQENYGDENFKNWNSLKMSRKLVLKSTQAKVKDKTSYDATSVNQTSKQTCAMLKPCQDRFGYQGT